MAEIKREPLVACDCCGVQAPKRQVGTGWANPLKWGSVNVAPTRYDQYPNNITLHDLCPDCNYAIWIAVSEAINRRKDVCRKKSSDE